MTDFYYNFTITGSGMSTSAYLAVNFTAGEMQNGAAVFYPTSTASTYVSFSNSFQGQIPPGRFSIGLVVLAGGNIAGTLSISPAVNVPITGTLTAFGKTLGSVTLQAGQTSVPFNFQGQGATKEDAAKALSAAVEKP